MTRKRRVCTVDGCGKPHIARGLCSRHYQRMKKYGSVSPPPCAHGTLEERFWRFVEKGDDDECWLWTGGNANRYGEILDHGGKVVKAHRVSWIIHRGAIPAGLHVLHHCDRGFCVNPHHLFLGTHSDNMADMAGKGRSTAGEKHPMSRLQEKDVLAIRELRAKGMLYREIARRYGITKVHAGNIANGKRWKHV